MCGVTDPAALALDGFTIHVSGAAPCAVVRLVGELDMLGAPRLADALTRLLDLGYRRVDLDLAELAFLAAAGLAVLAEADRRFRDISGRLRLVRPTPASLRLFAITGLDTTLTIR